MEMEECYPERKCDDTYRTRVHVCTLQDTECRGPRCYLISSCHSGSGSLTRFQTKCPYAGHDETVKFRDATEDYASVIPELKHTVEIEYECTSRSCIGGCQFVLTALCDDAVEMQADTIELPCVGTMQANGNNFAKMPFKKMRVYK